MNRYYDSKRLWHVYDGRHEASGLFCRSKAVALLLAVSNSPVCIYLQSVVEICPFNVLR